MCIYLIIFDIFSNVFISLCNEGIILEQRIEKNIERIGPSLISGYFPTFLASVEGKHV